MYLNYYSFLSFLFNLPKCFTNKFKTLRLFRQTIIPRTTVDINKEEEEAIKRVLNSGQFVKGKEALVLEEEFTRFQEV